MEEELELFKTIADIPCIHASLAYEFFRCIDERLGQAFLNIMGGQTGILDDEGEAYYYCYDVARFVRGQPPLD